MPFPYFVPGLSHVILIESETGFYFVPRLPRAVAHSRRLKGSKDNTDGTYTVKLRLTSAIRCGVLCYLGLFDNGKGQSLSVKPQYSTVLPASVNNGKSTVAGSALTHAMVGEQQTSLVMTTCDAFGNKVSTRRLWRTRVLFCASYRS